ncbi:MAG: hypothetical protein HUJ11_05560 [Arenibacter algicola]|nr:hypothetical protein [Arenibacter algicola]
MTEHIRIVHLFAALALVPVSAFAQDGGDKPTPPDPFEGVVHEVSISLEDCRRMVGHIPDADVAYRAGEDVYGNPVTPAEGPDAAQAIGKIELPDEIVIDFGYDFAGAYGIPNTGLESATANILTINYDLAVGGLTVNGKPLKKADSRAVAKACELMLTGGGAQAK